MGSDFPFPLPIDGYVSQSDPIVRGAIWRAHGRLNFWTRAPLSYEEMYLDHVWPKSRGGPDHLFNLVPTTKEINDLKRDRLDVVAATAVLALLRTYHGPKALQLMQRRDRRWESLKADPEAPFVLWLRANASWVRRVPLGIDPRKRWRWLAGFLRAQGPAGAVSQREPGVFPTSMQAYAGAYRVGIRIGGYVPQA